MERISDDTVKLTDDEQILGDFYQYLRTTRGMTDEQAMAFLDTVSAKAVRVLTGDFLAYLTDGEPLAADRMVRCLYQVWPYSVNNMCVLAKGHEVKLHEDLRGRKFDNTHYVDREPATIGHSGYKPPSNGDRAPHSLDEVSCDDPECQCSLPPSRKVIQFRRGKAVFTLVEGREYRITTMVPGVERKPRYSRMAFMGLQYREAVHPSSVLQFSGRGPDRTHSGRYCGTAGVTVQSILFVEEVERDDVLRYAFQRMRLD